MKETKTTTTTRYDANGKVIESMVVTEVREITANEVNI